MGTFKSGRCIICSLMVFLLAGIADANITERLEEKYLKSRIKMRIDEGGK